jgi:DNA invertase Pin-like site-specific DNA recombinase
MRAYVYSRWSSLEQGKRRDGEDIDANTLSRQVGNATRFAKDRGWDIVEIITDQGRSAYTGENLTTGNLGKFTTRLEQQLIPDGSCLIVEKLDRISRLPPSEMYDWFRKVMKLGLSIAVANDNRVYSREVMDTDPWAFMNVIQEAFRSYGESKRKSELLTDSWRDRRADLASGKIKKTTTVGPAWLEWDRESRTWLLKDDGQGPLLDRAAIVRRIFDQAEKGFGRRMIAKLLNDEGVPCWGRGESKGNGWHDSYIAKILTNKAVLGEKQDYTKPKAAKHRTPIGEPIQGYYPRIIDEDQFARVQAQNKRVANTGSSAKGAYNNLFSGLCYCQSCGGKMRFLLKSRKPDGDDESYFVCDTADRRIKDEAGSPKCEQRQLWRYPWFERSVLNSLLHLALDDSYFATASDVGRIQQQVAQLERDLEIKRARRKRFLTLYGDGDDDAREAYEQVRDEVKADEDTLARLSGELVEAKGRVSPAEHLKRVSNVRAAMSADDQATRYEARARVSMALHQVVSFARFDQAKRTSMVVLLGGAHALQLDDQGKVLNQAGVLGSIDEQLKRSLTGGDPYEGMLLDDMAKRSKATA